MNNPDEQWQSYDEQGEPIAGKGLRKEEAYQGPLHAAAHVWIWRERADEIEILLQKRKSTKKTFANMLDISAAGHVDLDETPLHAAVRETTEEIGLAVDPGSLRLIGVVRQVIRAEDQSWTENEWCWLYGFEMVEDADFTLQESEVAELMWRPIKDIERDVLSTPNVYVPHGETYYRTVFDGIRRLQESKID